MGYVRITSSACPYDSTENERSENHGLPSFVLFCDYHIGKKRAIRLVDSDILRNQYRFFDITNIAHFLVIVKKIPVSPSQPARCKPTGNRSTWQKKHTPGIVPPGVHAFLTLAFCHNLTYDKVSHFSHGSPGSAQQTEDGFMLMCRPFNATKVI